jgi:curli production assembly/transport component CsgG
MDLQLQWLFLLRRLLSEVSVIRFMIICSVLLLMGCETIMDSTIRRDPEIAETPQRDNLYNFPPISTGKPVTVAVYNFGDRTGQRKPADTIASLSSAVTQGAEIYLIKALMDMSNGQFFKVVERGGLDSLIKERQLIRNTRENFDGENAKKLGPLQFAGIMIEGGVVGYDSNKYTGGAGVRWLGIGPQTEWRVDVVTIGLRAISVLTGEVLLAVTTEKTILSTNVGVNVFKFFDMGTKVLEIEAGTSTNEPVNYAVRQAIEAAVIEMVKEGKRKQFWDYANNNKKASK